VWKPLDLLSCLAAGLFHCNKEMESGLDCYDPERRVFPTIADKARAGDKLSKRDVLLILRWKLGWLVEDHSRTVADYNMRLINEAIKEAQTNGSKALDMLRNIPNIELAVATAILTVCYPSKFTIIDTRVLKMLNLFPSTLPVHRRNQYTTNDWTPKDYFDEFFPEVEKRRKQWRCELRKADQALWGLSVSQDVERIIANS